MIENDSSVEFFNNEKVPYMLKAGVIAVLAHTAVGYSRNSQNQDMFMAMAMNKEIKDGVATRNINAAVNFTFGVPASMGIDNFLASMKGLVELYPSMNEIVEQIADGTLKKSDKEVCKIVLDASTQRFTYNAEGVEKNWENYVSANFDKFQKQALDHYPGIVTLDMFENMKKECGTLCSKQTQASQMA